MSTFFGLGPSYKINLHKTIFAMITFGKGGWTWNDLYHMPVFLRNFYFEQMTEVMKREAASMADATPSR
jgi:hypothetical protein